LIVQVAAFGIFLIVTVHFDIKSRKVVGEGIVRPLKPLMAAIYITGSLITARSIFRVIGEFVYVAIVELLTKGACRVWIAQV
jgi:hypothetical protein